MGLTTNTRQLTREAADRLLGPDRGADQVTVDLIYAEIKQGSRTTINEELKKWRLQKRESSAPPPAVPDVFNPLWVQLWQAFTKEAHQSFEADRERIEGEVAAANRVADQFAERNEQLLGKVEVQSTELKQKTEEVGNLQQELIAVRGAAGLEQAVAQTRIQALGTALDEERSRAATAAEQAFQSMASLREEHSRREAQLREDSRVDRERQDQVIAQSRSDLDREVEAGKRTQGELDAARARSEELSRQLAVLQVQAARQMDDLATAQTALETSQKEMHAVAGALHAAQIESASLRATLHAKEQALQTAEARLAADEKDLQDLRSQLLERSNEA